MTYYVPGTEETDLKKIIMSLQQVAAAVGGGEGTWTPTLTFATPGDLTVAYALRNAYYTKIGRLVSASFVIVTSTFTFLSASGNLTLTGLPFTSINDANYRSYAPILWGGITKAGYTQMTSVAVGNTTNLLVVGSGSGVAIAVITAADTPTGGTVALGGTINYVV